MTDSERFWSRVSIPSEDDCWEWQAARDTHGYGRFSVGGRLGTMKLSHRVSWELVNGPIPTGLMLLHSCDNPPCVNPDRLSAGTQLDNMRDMAIKGRSGVRKLSNDQVREIRRLASEGSTQRALADAFGVSRSNVSQIVRRKSRVHMDDFTALLNGSRPE